MPSCGESITDHGQNLEHSQRYRRLSDRQGSMESGFSLIASRYHLPWSQNQLTTSGQGRRFGSCPSCWLCPSSAHLWVNRGFRRPEEEIIGSCWFGGWYSCFWGHGLDHYANCMGLKRLIVMNFNSPNYTNIVFHQAVNAMFHHAPWLFQTIHGTC